MPTKNGWWILKVLLSNMVVKQGCPISPTPCSDKLEEVVNKVAREEGLNAPKLMQNVIVLLLYADDVVLFSYDVDSMQHLLGVLDDFFHSSGLVVNVEKTKMMVVQTIQPHHYPMLTYID